MGSAQADYKTVRFSGKERDATGLYYYGYRYYQPWAGRWLSADPAYTVDGLNLYSMVHNNPGTHADSNGLMTSSSQDAPEPHRSSTLRIKAKGLLNFPPNEAGIVAQALTTAADALRKVVERGQPSRDSRMEIFFGPQYGVMVPRIVESWKRLERVVAAYATPAIGYPKIDRATRPDSTVLAQVLKKDVEGKIFIFDNFFSKTISDQTRAATIIHEISHLKRVPGIPSASASTRDFFYLADNIPMQDSHNVAYLGELTTIEVADPISFFYEIAILNNYEIIRIEEQTMHYKEHGRSAQLSLSDAVSTFKKNDYLRAHITSKNADSIAYSVMTLAHWL
ncbi:RHS repeat-associated core domain-containing protein [Pseudomonas putida]|uniref:RHS repeat-associated core domain-containing protein n=1 Tax=Pseudomonas putida TaxID=303 RepID=UPI0019686DC0|nr:RHS repeat-associated core domain-containing protein [Pseudomonas putida]